MADLDMAQQAQGYGSETSDMVVYGEDAKTVDKASAPASPATDSSDDEYEKKEEKEVDEDPEDTCVLDGPGVLKLKNEHRALEVIYRELHDKVDINAYASGAGTDIFHRYAEHIPIKLGNLEDQIASENICEPPTYDIPKEHVPSEADFTALYNMISPPPDEKEETEPEEAVVLSDAEKKELAEKEDALLAGEMDMSAEEKDEVYGGNPVFTPPLDDESNPDDGEDLFAEASVSDATSGDEFKDDTASDDAAAQDNGDPAILGAESEEADPEDDDAIITSDSDNDPESADTEDFPEEDVLEPLPDEPEPEPEAPPPPVVDLQRSFEAMTSEANIDMTSPEILSSVEFKPLMGTGFDSPFKTGIINNGKELRVTPAARLLEMQIEVKQQTGMNVTNIMNEIVRKSIDSAFSKLYSAYASSGGEIFSSFEKPDSVSEVKDNLDTYLADIYEHMSEQDGDWFDDFIDGSSSQRSYIAAVFYYFVNFVFSQKFIAMITESNIAASQTIFEQSAGGVSVADFVGEEVYNSSLSSLISNNFPDLDADECNRILSDKFIVDPGISVSENICRVLKAIFITGYGMNVEYRSSTETGFSTMAAKANASIPKFLQDDYGLLKIINANQRTQAFFNGFAFSTQGYSILDTSKRFYGSGQGGLYDGFKTTICTLRDPDHMSKLLNIVLADRSNYQGILDGRSHPSIKTEIGGEDEPLSINSIGMTFSAFSHMDGYGTDSESEYSPGSSNPGLASENGGSSGNHALKRMSEFISEGFYVFHPFEDDSGAQHKLQSGIQSNPLASVLPKNQLTFGVPANGLCFDTNSGLTMPESSNIPGGDSLVVGGSNEHAIVNIFDIGSNLPGADMFGTTVISEYVDPNNTLALNPNNLPFAFASDYANAYHTLGVESYRDSMEAVRDITDSIVSQGGRIFSKKHYSGPTLSGFQGQKEWLENFFESLADVFIDYLGDSDEDFVDRPLACNAAVTALVLNHVGGNNRTSDWQEDLYMRYFLLLCDSGMQELNNRAYDGTADTTDTELNDLFSDGDHQPLPADDSESIHASENRLGLVSRVANAILGHCWSGVNMKDYNANGDSDADKNDICIEDYLYDEDNNLFGGGMYSGGTVSYLYRPGKNLNRSVTNPLQNGWCRSDLFDEIETGDQFTEVAYDSRLEFLGADNVNTQSTRDGSSLQSYFCTENILHQLSAHHNPDYYGYGPMYNGNPLVKQLLIYADLYEGYGAKTAPDGGYDTERYNPYGSTLGFSGDGVPYEESDSRKMGLGTNKFAILACLYNILGFVCDKMAIGTVLGAGDSSANNDSGDPRPVTIRWNTNVARVIGFALKGTSYTSYGTKDYDYLYDEVLEFRNLLLGNQKDVHKEHLACMRFIDTLSSRFDTIVNELGSAGQAAGEISEIYEYTSENQHLYDNFFNEQQEILTQALNIKLLSPSKNNWYLPSSKDVTRIQIAKMVKYFSQQGRGYLSHESSVGDLPGNKANKMILTVGIPNGLISTLNQSAEFTTGETSVGKPQKTVIELTVMKKNVLNDAEIYYIPKKFTFDCSKFIFENARVIPPETGTSDPTTLLTGDINEQMFKHQRLYHIGRSKVLNNLKVSFLNGSAIDDMAGHLSDYEAGTEPGYDSNASTDLTQMTLTQEEYDDLRNVFSNHMTDYYAKMYARTMVGIDVDEDVFQFPQTKPNTLYNGNDPSLEGIFDQYFYKKMLNLTDLLPDDPAFTYEFNRIVKEARRSLLFSPDKYIERVLKPRVFDRVFSMVIDEGDFIPIEVKPFDQWSFSGTTTIDSPSQIIEIAATCIDAIPDYPPVDGTGHTTNMGKTELQEFILDQAVTSTASLQIARESDIGNSTIYQYHCSVALKESDLDFNQILEEEILQTEFADSNSESRGGVVLPAPETVYFNVQTLSL